MDTPLHAVLAPWSNFYLITGSAAAALTGLQFVVQTLLSSDELRNVRSGDPEEGIAAFGTPTIVHFTLALTLSAMMCAPWPQYLGLRASLGILSTGALGYSAIVMRRATTQSTYRAQTEDWIFHVILPIISYVAVLVAAVLVDHDAHGPLFALAAATLLLICIGIHNAWDTVTYLTVRAIRQSGPDKKEPPIQRRDTHRKPGRKR